MKRDLTLFTKGSLYQGQSRSSTFSGGGGMESIGFQLRTKGAFHLSEMTAQPLPP